MIGFECLPNSTRGIVIRESTGKAMDNSKELKTPTSDVLSDEISQHAEFAQNVHGGNGFDQHDMHRMGKKQELRRNFEFFSIVGFVSILQATWESTLVASYIGLFNGGTAGVIWLTIVSWFCFLLLIASMAEMASMAPTAFVHAPSVSIVHR